VSVDMADRIKIAVLISGGGTTLKNLIDRIDSGTLNAEIALVISSNSKAVVSCGSSRSRAILKTESLTFTPV